MKNLCFTMEPSELVNSEPSSLCKPTTSFSIIPNRPRVLQQRKFDNQRKITQASPQSLGAQYPHPRSQRNPAISHIPVAKTIPSSNIHLRRGPFAATRIEHARARRPLKFSRLTCKINRRRISDSLLSLFLLSFYNVAPYSRAGTRRRPRVNGLCTL